MLYRPPQPAAGWTGTGAALSGIVYGRIATWRRRSWDERVPVEHSSMSGIGHATWWFKKLGLEQCVCRLEQTVRPSTPNPAK